MTGTLELTKEEVQLAIQDYIFKTIGLGMKVLAYKFSNYVQEVSVDPVTHVETPVQSNPKMVEISIESDSDKTNIKVIQDRKQ